MESNDISQLIAIAGLSEDHFKIMVIRMMKFSPERFLALFNEKPYEPFITEQAHINKLKLIVARHGIGNKIPAIKEIREYCNINGFHNYIGLREAKEFFEANV